MIIRWLDVLAKYRVRRVWTGCDWLTTVHVFHIQNASVNVPCRPFL